MIIYKFTNTVNNKAYIGFSKYTITERWNQHTKLAAKDSDNRKFYNAIRTYGHDVWQKEVIATVDTVKQAKQLEIQLIAEHDTYNTGYNSTLGGDGFSGNHREESKRKASKALKGIPKDYDRMLGKLHSEQSKHKISEAHKGMKKPWVKWSKEQITTRAMTRRSLTKEQYDEIHTLRNQGKLIREIVSIAGHSNDIVKKWLKKEWVI
jgi:group I intron endonuclease